MEVVVIKGTAARWLSEEAWHGARGVPKAARELLEEAQEELRRGNVR